MKEELLKTLEIMGYGMLAIFIVIAILIAVVQLLKAMDKLPPKALENAKYQNFKNKLKSKLKIKDASEDAQTEDKPADGDKL